MIEQLAPFAPIIGIYSIALIGGFFVMEAFHQFLVWIFGDRAYQDFRSENEKAEQDRELEQAQTENEKKQILKKRNRVPVASARIIGTLERFIFVTAIVIGQEAAIFGWIALKTAVQYKTWQTLENRHHFNLYLSRMLVSALFCAFCGWWILGFPLPTKV